jgi:nitrite reductase/ring-hydroxylating ferredoxin subunit/DMSO/TMAO reductase YedYZ heme-binding membrane subunit
VAPGDLVRPGGVAAGYIACRIGHPAERTNGSAGDPVGTAAAMSARYRPVGWNASKLVYDALVLAAIVLYIGTFLWLAPKFQHVTLPLDDYSIRMAAFGTCAFLLLTGILCIGPLARLDSRFLPLLYNRRHLGVLTCAVALTHASAALDWYFTYSLLDPYVALLSGNTSFGRAQGFPFELFGIAALLVLLLLAATSHDFWLSFLTPPVWKALHMSLYGGYLAAVLHVALGALQAARNPLLAVVMVLCVTGVGTLHVAAGMRERRRDRSVAPPHARTPWVNAGPVAAIEEGRGIVVHLDGADPVAIFRYRGRISAVGNVCAHQNGPLGEGRVIEGCVTCPWHGFQYRLEDGCAPPPYTEKLPTYRLRLEHGVVLLDPSPNPLGTWVEPLEVP